MKCSPFLNTLLLSLFFLVLQPGKAQQQDTLSLQQKPFFVQLKNDGKIALDGIKEVYLSPLHWKKNDLFTAGSVALGTGLLYTVDEETSRYFRNQKKDIPRIFLDAGRYASPEAIFAMNGAVYLSGLLLKNEKLRHTGLLLVTSATASGLLLSAGKVIVGRGRPMTGEGKNEFSSFNFTDDRYRSFPSGHVLFAFSTAYAIGKQFKNPYIKAGIYSLGLIAPASRLWEGQHWLTDTVVSMALGIAVVESLDRYLKNQQENFSKDRKKISWNLHLGPTTVGIIGTF